MAFNIEKLAKISKPRSEHAIELVDLRKQNRIIKMSMKTIEQRATEYMREYPNMDDSHYDYYVRDGYIKGAIDQKAIDDEEYRKDMRYIGVKREELIDKAIDWLVANGFFGRKDSDGANGLREALSN